MSVRGTSHEQTGAPCQDASHVSPVSVPAGDFVIAATADGAGSASHSDLGAQAACRAFFEAACRDLEQGMAELTKEELELRAADLVQRWFLAARAAVVQAAEAADLPPRQLASTLLGAVIGPTWSIFGQLGDGALVVEAESRLVPVFWPEETEYANVTSFLVDRDFERSVQHRVMEPTHRLAAISDGLQRVALEFDTRAVHQSFFEPMFRSLETSEDPSDLEVPLRAWLDSKLINGRTDDDKTLLLVSRVSPEISGDDSL